MESFIISPLRLELRGESFAQQDPTGEFKTLLLKHLEPMEIEEKSIIQG